MRCSTLAVVVLVAFAVAACKTSREEDRAPLAAVPAARAEASVPSLALVSDRSSVCMVTNRFMGKPQIPVEVDGKTYFGCCEMCKARLGQELGLREAEDPYSHKRIDKALAVLAKDAEGNVVYFESEANLRAAAGLREKL